MKYLNKIIECGLYLFVFTLPVQTRWIIKAGYTEYSTYSLYGTDILLLAILLLFVIFQFSIFNFQFSIKFLISNFQTNYKLQTWWLIVWGLVLASGVSIFFALEKLLALYKFGWLILGVGLFWLIISANYSKLKLIYALLIGIFLQAILGIWQFLIQSSFSSKWLGIASHDPINLGVSVVEIINKSGVSERWLRAYGGLDHPNILGGMIVIGILLLIGQIIMTGRTNNFQFSIFNFQIIFNFKILKIIDWLLVLIFSMALFFSFSRSAWIGLIVGLIIMIVLAFVIKDLLLQKLLAKIILIMGVLFLVLFSQYQNLVITRVSSDGRLENKSITERVASYQDCWGIIKNNWLFGIGAGNYTLAIRDKIFINQTSYNYQPSHNTFLLIWSEVGIFGLIFFIGMLYLLVIFNFQFLISNKIQNSKFKIQNLTILSCLTIFMLFDHWLWSLHFGVLFFWLIIGLVFNNSYLKYNILKPKA